MMGRDPSVRANADASLAPFFVSLREAERNILRAAFETFEGNLYLMGDALGLTHHYIRDRMQMLGGCTFDPLDVVNEPPKPSQYTRKNLPVGPREKPKPKGTRRRAKLRHVNPTSEVSTHGPDQPAHELDGASVDLHAEG